MSLTDKQVADKIRHAAEAFEAAVNEGVDHGLLTEVEITRTADYDPPAGMRIKVVTKISRPNI